MFFEEFGDKSKPTVVLLHGANLVQSFVKQYSLLNKYHLVLPHITGYGKEAGSVFTTERAVRELSELIFSFGGKVTLVGFSLGAQLAFVLMCENPELINGAVCVSPWLIKEEPMLSKVVKQNDKNFGLLKKEWYVKLCGKMSGLDKEQTDELIEHCMALKKDTILNSVDNGIEFDEYPQFKDVSFPVLALAGKKELDVVTRSVMKMAELNPNCSYEIWDKAAHNIPSKLADKFTARLDEFLGEINNK